MERKLFKLDDEDFNRIIEISANDAKILQIYEGRVFKATKEERADHFWKSVALKYGFDPNTVQTELPNYTHNYFSAIPLEAK